MYGIKKRNQLNKKELRVEEVSAKAFEVYSNSDLYFYEDQNGNIYLDNQDGYCSIIGDLEDLDQLLIEYQLLVEYGRGANNVKISGGNFEENEEKNGTPYRMARKARSSL